MTGTKLVRHVQKFYFIKAVALLEARYNLHDRKIGERIDIRFLRDKNHDNKEKI